MRTKVYKNDDTVSSFLLTFVCTDFAAWLLYFISPQLSAPGSPRMLLDQLFIFLEICQPLALSSNVPATWKGFFTTVEKQKLVLVNFVYQNPLQYNLQKGEHVIGLSGFPAFIFYKYR